MELSQSGSSSFGLLATRAYQNASTYQAKLPINPAVKSTYISNTCSQILLSTKLYSRKSYHQEKESSSYLVPNKYYGRKAAIPLIRASTRLEGDRSVESPIKKALTFSRTALKFVKLQIVLGSTMSFAAVAARTWMENAHLVTLSKWTLIVRGLAALVCILCADGYIGGMNQIFDLEIDKINKPHLPIASGEMSLGSAWFLMVNFVATGISVAVGVLKSGALLATLCFEFFLGAIYSVPPIYLKKTTIGAILTCGSMRGYGFTLLLAAAAAATLGIPFKISPSVAFISIFATLVFLSNGLTKDLQDLEGDRKNNVPTLALKIGPRKAAFLGFGFLLLAYGGAIAAAICMPQIFRRSVMIPAHAILGSRFLYQAWKLDKSNYSQEESVDFYKLVWQLFELEFILFPFI